MQQQMGCFDPHYQPKEDNVSKIKNLRDLLQQDSQFIELFDAISDLSKKAREAVQPAAVSFSELMENIRAETTATARNTVSEVKEEVDETLKELVTFFREQGFELEILTPSKREAVKDDSQEDFVAAVQRLLDEQAATERANLLQAASDEHVTADELWDLVDLQEEVLVKYVGLVEQAEAQLEAQAKLAEGANARCTGLYEGILSALQLIDNLDIIRAKEHLLFTLRQAGASDCDIFGARG